MKPCVDTGNVKAVLAIGQDPTRFSLLELRQAHGAFRRRFFLLRFEDECGKRVDGAEIEALGSEDGGGGRRGGDADCEATEMVVVGVAVTAAAPAGVDVECDYDEAGGEEDGDGGNHDFALEGVPD